MSLNDIVQHHALHANASNTVEFEVSGKYGLFTDPITKLGGEKFSYQVPTHSALRGIMWSIYDKPTLSWYIDAVRIMNPIVLESKSILVPQYATGKKDLSYYCYLRNCRYQVRAHFEWNMNRPELTQDRIEKKHHAIALRAIKKGGYRDVFLGTRECHADVEPCVFGEGVGAYDNVPEMHLGMMLYGFTYADEAYSPETQNKLTEHLWSPVMRHGVIEFPRPEECLIHRTLRSDSPTVFCKGKNFSGVDEMEGFDWESSMI